MAGPVILLQRLLAPAALLLCGAALAQGLPDPTRPPAILSAPASMPTGGPADSGPVLQSILRSPQRQVAIISGQTVPLHGKFGEQTLIRMTETEVVLSNGKQQQTLKLFPDFEKKSSPNRAKGDAGSAKTEATRP